MAATRAAPGRTTTGSAWSPSQLARRSGSPSIMSVVMRPEFARWATVARPGNCVPCPPFDEEGQRGLGDGLFDAHASPGDRLTTGCCPRSCADVEAQPPSDHVELVSANRPAERLPELGRAAHNPPPEDALGSFRLVDHRSELEVGLPERHDPVRRAPARMAPTLDRGQAVPVLEFPRRRREIRDRDHDVVELHPDRAYSSDAEAPAPQCPTLSRYTGRIPKALPAPSLSVHGRRSDPGGSHAPRPLPSARRGGRSMATSSRRQSTPNKPEQVSHDE